VRDIVIISKRSFWVIVLSAIIGVISCLLPWSYSPGFIAYPINGVLLSPTIKDNGGVLVIVMLILEVMLSKYLQKESRTSAYLLIAPVIIPILITIEKILEVLTWILKYGNIEPPTIGVGTIVVLLSSFVIAIIIFISTRQILFRKI
jgi:hypothetical protein